MEIVLLMAVVEPDDRGGEVVSWTDAQQCESSNKEEHSPTYLPLQTD